MGRTENWLSMEAGPLPPLSPVPSLADLPSLHNLSHRASLPCVTDHCAFYFATPYDSEKRGTALPPARLHVSKGDEDV